MNGVLLGMRSLLVTVLLLGLVACARQTEENQMIGLAANIYNVATDTDLIDRAEQGLAAWKVSLNTGFRARYRNAGGAPGSYDPPNWLALSPRSCSVMGAPADMRTSCPLSDANVVGVCQVVNDPLTGKILNTTALISRDYQLNEVVALSDRLSIFTHEIGHCLGLKHSPSVGDVMYYSTAGADVPSADELGVIQYAYTTYQAPSDTSRFFTANGQPLRHFTAPAIFLYDETSYTGSNALTMQSQSAPTSEDLNNPVEVHNILLYADGREVHYRSR